MPGQGEPTYSAIIHLTLLGEPVAKARAKTVRLPNGKSHSYTPQATTAAEDAWRYLFKSSGLPPLPPKRPLGCTVDLYLARPPSVPKTRIRPMTAPDDDNLVKLVKDALQKFAYENDSRFCDTHIRKWYADYPEQPKTELTIWVVD
jgi:Holliday junction resolvase RusA-like endonuclease